MTEEFNGWVNRETWAMNLHLSNDHGLYLETQSATFRGLVGAEDFACEHPEVTLNVYRHVAREIEAMVQEWRDDLEEFGAPGSDVEPGLLSMFLEIGSLWRVDWDEIAGGWLDQFPVELLTAKTAVNLIENERPLGHAVHRCPDCDCGVILWDDGDVHVCDWRPVAADVLGIEAVRNG
jgi:hypothetical protein